MREYTYWTATGPVTVDVEDGWAAMLEDLDRIDYNNGHKQYRRSDDRGLQDWATPRGLSAEDEFLAQDEFEDKMAKLTDMEHAVITLIYSLGQNQAQTAEHLEMAQQTVSDILNRARRKLREE